MQSLNSVIMAYLTLLKMDMGGDRASSEIQTALCCLRNFIAKKENRSIQEVQEDYEDIAAFEKSVNC